MPDGRRTRTFRKSRMSDKSVRPTWPLCDLCVLRGGKLFWQPTQLTLFRYNEPLILHAPPSPMERSSEWTLIHVPKITVREYHSFFAAKLSASNSELTTARS